MCTNFGRRTHGLANTVNSLPSPLGSLNLSPPSLYFALIGVCVCVCVCVCAHACVCTQSCPTLWDSIDYSLPGSSVHGILQAIILEWVAISSSRGSSWPRDHVHVCWGSCIGRQFLYPLSYQGSHKCHVLLDKCLLPTVTTLPCMPGSFYPSRRAYN